jgi:FkbM family methyltransferase
MILEAFYNKFKKLASAGINFQYVLDIGAYRGDFSQTIFAVWPYARIWQFEADERNSKYVPHAHFLLLGDSERDVTFYTLPEHLITTGSSIFRELTHHYSEAATIKITKRMTTLDKFCETPNIYGDWTRSGLVKLDTQGSELLILEGAKKFLEERLPAFILIECSIREYNEGAPKMNDVLSYMNALGYEVFDFLDFSYLYNGSLLQTDILFKRI